MELTRPAWIEVNLDYLAHNIQTIQREIGNDTKILSIVKSDGYKFGAVKLVETLIECGIEFFGVATLSEGLSLRNHYKNIHILILGYTPDYLMEASVKNDITISLYSLDSARKLNQVAKEQDKKCKVHIVVDSGMNRIGFKPNEKSLDEIQKIMDLEYLDVEGIFTHFAVADTDEAYTKYQFNNYMYIVKGLEDRGITIKYKHVSNSHATIKYRDFDLSFVRPGILQYGSTEDDPAGEPFDVKFIGQVKAQIGHLKTIPSGEGISYGLTYKTEEESKIATLPLGYADGIPRMLSNKIDVLVGGKRCPQVGRICMDQFMVDVTGVDCKVGDEVVIVGKQLEEEITIEEISALADEIPTSFVTHFNKRLPKVYIKDGEVVEIEDLVLNL
ncbi:MAG: alanine racemase [Tissierellia bacterium]|nr:alanine racemase [Tissierellia bacterium]